MTDTGPIWTAIILAGQRPGKDPLATHFGEAWKALVQVGGEPMLRRVTRTIAGVPRIGRIIIVAQSPDALRHAVDPAAMPRAEWRQSADNISGSLLALFDAPGGDALWPALVTTADHPLLTGAMVDQFLDDASGADPADLAVAMVERKVMLAQFPDAQRTWLRLADGAWSGANLFAFASPAARAALMLWQAAEVDRKRPWRLFRHFGLGLALRAITRTIGLGDALARVGRRYAMVARLVPMRDPVAAIDVDKPADHALAEAILQAREV